MFLKLLTSVIGLLLVIQAHAANYYFSASGNDAYTNTQAQNSATPWKTLSKLNSYFSKLNPGDSVLFKRGETFTGPITILKSGTAAKPIIISAYGKGARPILSGFVPATGWVNLGGGIYEAACPLAASAVNVVTLNGVPQPIGRYPNANAANGGYLNITGYIGKTQVSSSQLNTAINWTGGSVVIRKNHFTITRGTITSNTTNAVNYTETSAFTVNNNFGFFVQNHPKTLDQYGEWYYDAVNKKIRMYLGTTAPNNNSVSVSGYDYIIDLKGYNYITINGLAFTGGNIANIAIFSTIGFQVKNSTLTSSGGHNISANSTTDFVVANCNFLNSGNDGIYSKFGTNTQVINDTLKNSGIIAGMGMPGDGSSYEAVVAIGDNALIANNIVQNCGANGIDFGGNYTTVKNNFISNFELVKDDGGGLYTYNGGSADSLQRYYGISVLNNIIINSVGAPAGTTGNFPGCASGIYLDDNSNGLTVAGNTISNCVTGLYVHNSRELSITGNTFYNNQSQVLFQHNTPKYTIKNNTFSNNIVFSAYKTQPTLLLLSIANDLKRFSTFTSNYYSNTIDNVFPISAIINKLDLQLWQYTFNNDLNSVNAPIIPSYTVNIPSKKSKFSNATFAKNINSSTAWSANGNLKAIWDNAGGLDGGSVKTYFSFISGSSGNNPMLLSNVGAVNTSTTYQIKFSMNCNKANRKIVIYLRNTNSPYNSISEAKYITTNNKRFETTLMVTPTVSTSAATIVFAFQDEDITTWIDNLNVYTTNAQPIPPTDNIFFAYNATPKSKVVKLASAYLDVKKKAYKGSATLAPFTSILLIKNQDTLATLPPVVYVTPPATDTAAVDGPSTPTQKPPVAAAITVYPNPSTDHFMFSFNDPNIKDFDIKVMNTNGDVILSQKARAVNSSYQLNFNTKPAPGFYFIHLSGAGINQTAKVVII